MNEHNEYLRRRSDRETQPVPKWLFIGVPALWVGTILILWWLSP